jgi:hypothetical protein
MKAMALLDDVVFEELVDSLVAPPIVSVVSVDVTSSE